jgi:hypothetical protein
MKRLKGKRTMIFAAAMAALPTADAVREIVNIFLSTPEFGAIIPPHYYPYYALAVALGTAILRVFTTTPVGRDE